jgi:hypothetical protein
MGLKEEEWDSLCSEDVIFDRGGGFDLCTWKPTLRCTNSLGFSLRPCEQNETARSPITVTFSICQLTTMFVLSLLSVDFFSTFICPVPFSRTCSNGAYTHVWDAPLICSCVSVYCSTYPSSTACSASTAFWRGVETGQESSVPNSFASTKIMLYARNLSYIIVMHSVHKVYNVRRWT